MVEKLYEIKNLSKTYYDDGVPVTVLRGVELEISKGDSIGIMGPSGAGKSTLLHILGLMDSAYGGEIRYKGTSLSEISDREKSDILRRDIGFLFQFHYLISELSVFENVALPLRLLGTFDEKKIDETMRSLDIYNKKRSYPHELSGGEKQRVALARALVKEPEVLFCDEPTGNLDTPNGEVVKNLLRERHAEKNFTLFIVTHNPELCSIADKKIHMVDGRIVP